MSVLHEIRFYLLIAVVALLSWWLVQTNQERQAAVKLAENSPDLFSSGYYKLRMDIDGLPKSELVADNMQHYSKDGSSHLQKPVMTLYKANQAPWVIKSETAIMAGDGDNVQLNGKAFISRDAYGKNSALSIDTANLRVKLSTHFAETQADTEIVSPPNKTSGKGMEVTFDSPIHLKLLSTVKGRYELNK